MRATPAARPPHMAILAIAVLPVVSHLVIMATRHVQLGLIFSFGGLFKLGFVTISALTHWSIYVSLLAAFGLTLRQGREPLITALVRRMHGLTPERVSYTRKVTIAWTLFFAAQLSLSIALFCFAPLVVWSFFVNILDLPLVVLMFAAEYVVRLRTLRDPPRDSLSAIMG
ncbi:MAG TPA: hypothetical protein VEQ16_04210, partial [Acidocella sp.]|nr:hypothetical protein [Acidocella sp.]